MYLYNFLSLYTNRNRFYTLVFEQKQEKRARDGAIEESGEQEFEGER